MKRIIFYISIGCIFLRITSCTDQTSYKTVSLFENDTPHLITVKGYKNGTVNTLSEQTITAQQTKEVYVDQNDGKGRGLVYPGEIAGLDSLVVEFDVGIKAIHYSSLTKNGTNPSALDFSNSRNLFNENNWIFKTVKETKRRLESEFSYTFTEQDYLNAK